MGLANEYWMKWNDSIVWIGMKVTAGNVKLFGAVVFLIVNAIVGLFEDVFKGFEFLRVDDNGLLAGLDHFAVDSLLEDVFDVADFLSVDAHIVDLSCGLVVGLQDGVFVLFFQA